MVVLSTIIVSELPLEIDLSARDLKRCRHKRMYGPAPSPAKESLMSLLTEIQQDAIDADLGIAPTLLKLRLLASKLGIQELEDWVRYESEGYPGDADVPDYRILGVTYYADFVGPFNSQATNIAVPPHLIRTHAGDGWLDYRVRSGISEIDDSTRDKGDSGGHFQISNAQNLVYPLQGKMFEDYNIIQVRGIISSSGFAGIRHAVRARILELTIKLEEQFPDAAAQLATDSSKHVTGLDHTNASQMTSKIVYGNYTEVNNTGAAARVNVNVSSGDTAGLIEALTAAGLPEADAEEIAEVIANEEPTSKDEPLGPKAQNWLAKNLKKAADGTWKIGSTVATKVLSQAALRYYGL